VAAGDWPVLFYDISTRQAWLLDGHSALLHICRAWLESDHAKKLFKHCNGSADPITIFQHASAEGGMDEALGLLLNTRNRQIKLYGTERTSEHSSKHQKAEEKETPSQDTWGDIVDAQVRVLEYLRDQRTEKRSKRTGDVRSPFQQQRMNGYDFQEILKESRPLHDWGVPLRSSFGGWLDFVETCNAIPVFGAGFGDLLRPSKSHSSRHQTCLQKAALPQDNDYLAVSIEVLHQLTKDHLNNDSHCVKLGSSTYWTNPGASFTPCTCDQASCSMLIASLSSNKPVSTSPLTPVSELFMTNKRGAVIFPCTPNQVKKDPPLKHPFGKSSRVLSKIPPSSNNDQLSQHEQDSASPRDEEDARAGAQPEDDHTPSTLDAPPNQNTDAADRLEEPSSTPHDPISPPVPSASGTNIRAAGGSEATGPPNATQHQSNDDLIEEEWVEEPTAPAEHLRNVRRSGATGGNASQRSRAGKKKASQRLRKQAEPVRTQQTSIDWLRAWVFISTIVIAYLLAIIAGVL
jgi:hypothetical protein